jgi:hypothetical protein
MSYSIIRHDMESVIEYNNVIFTDFTYGIGYAISLIILGSYSIILTTSIKSELYYFELEFFVIVIFNFMLILITRFLLIFIH